MSQSVSGIQIFHIIIFCMYSMVFEYQLLNDFLCQELTKIYQETSVIYSKCNTCFFISMDFISTAKIKFEKKISMD